MTMKQTTMSSFLLDSAIVDNLQQRKRNANAKAARAEKAEKAEKSK